MILCIGEILVDIITSTSDDVSTTKVFAGGAPFNVCCNLNKIGIQSAFVGAIGDDNNGKFLANFAKEKVLESYLVNKSNISTTQAIVEIDKKGERSFRFLRSNTADYQLNLLDIPFRLLELADVIHLGSLMLTTAQGINLAKDIISYAKTHKKTLSFDVNLRQDLVKDYNIFVTVAKACDIVKMSVEELLFLTNQTELTAALKVFDKQLLVVSKGAEGSMASWKGQIIEVPTVKVKAIDTTGAGDAFFAGFLSQLYNNPLSRDNIFQWLQFANICGALTTTKLGAIDSFPSLEEVLLIKCQIS